MFAIQFNCPWYVCVLMAMVFGAIWAGIPGLLKAYLNVSEVLSGIMLNWVALFFTNYSFQTYLASCVNVRDGMKTFKLPNIDDEKSILKTIRIKFSTLKKVEELSKKNNLSVNRIINECIEFALENLNENDNTQNKKV